MNILYFFCEDNTFMTQWQRIHIFNELEINGHCIEVFNPNNYSSIEEANDKFDKYLHKTKNNYDLFMTCHGDSYVYKETIQTVKAKGIPTLLICFDNLHAPFMHKNIACYFDLVWLTSYETKYLFEKWNCNNIIIQPYAANPHIFTTTNQIKKTIFSVCFIGTPYGSRINKLNTLTNAKVYCDLYTDNFKTSQRLENIKNIIPKTDNLLRTIIQASYFDIGRKIMISSLINKIFYLNKLNNDNNSYLNIHNSISFQEMQELYSCYALSLNITELRNTYILNKPIHKIHLRTFEIPMCGGLQLASYSKELSSYFEEDKEIILYKTEDELISKCNFYLNPKNESLLIEIKKNARRRAQSDHTWINRFNNVFKLI